MAGSPSDAPTTRIICIQEPDIGAEKPASPDPGTPENSARDLSEAAVQEEAATQDLRWRKLRLFALGGLTLVGSSVLCLGMLTGSAAWYTSRSQFCSSCHIMEPYYASWQHSSHADVSCIKCHFAPGIGEKVRGKMQGLVQLCTYITRSEGPRPVAEVSDASCLRSGCHETRSLPGPLEFHGIVFDHGPHLQELDMAGATHDPGKTLEVVLDGQSSEDLHRGIKLRCTSCHEQIDQTEHMSVSTGTCFLCHFKEGLFNQGVVPARVATRFRRNALNWAVASRSRTNWSTKTASIAKAAMAMLTEATAMWHASDAMSVTTVKSIWRRSWTCN